MKPHFLKEKFYSVKENARELYRKRGRILPCLKEWWKEYWHTPQNIAKACLILNLYTLIVFNIPAMEWTLDSVEGGTDAMWTFVGAVFSIPLLACLYSRLRRRAGHIAGSVVIAFSILALLMNFECNWNGVFLFSSVVILMFVLNHLLYYLLLWLGRTVGKVIISITFIINAVCLYSIDALGAFITEPTIANVFNTRYSEASSFFSLEAVMYVLFLGVPPCIYLFVKKITYSKPLTLLVHTVVPVLVAVLVLFANFRNILWIDQNSTPLGGRMMPWSYIINTSRHIAIKLQGSKQEIILPDAQITTNSKDVCVLVIGESARRENFSLYGYARETNPLLAGDSVKAYVANADDVSTIGGVKAILSYRGGDDLYEILPNYLHRHGVDVVWRTANWGEPPLRIEKIYKKEDMAAMHPDVNAKYDGVLFAGLAEEIQNCGKDKQLIVVHGYTSHGPKYYENYPAEFEKFTPVCTTNTPKASDRQGLVNAYDNTILYTDYLLHSVIETLKQVEGKRCCMIYVSDHGESLGEGDMYMHGVLPKKWAPREQIEIPFIVWQNDSTVKMKDFDCIEQFYVYHSVLKWFGMESPIYNEKMNVFAPVEQ